MKRKAASGKTSEKPSGKRQPGIETFFRPHTSAATTLAKATGDGICAERAQEGTTRSDTLEAALKTQKEKRPRRNVLADCERSADPQASKSPKLDEGAAPNVSGSPEHRPIDARQPEPPVSGAATWNAGDPVPYSALCDTFAKIELTTKRLQILAYMIEFFKKVMERSPNDLLTSVYLCINRLGPTHEGLELGIGEHILEKAIAEGTGRPVSKVKEDYRRLGDLGLAAEASRVSQKPIRKPRRLTLQSVFKDLKNIARTTGGSSVKSKLSCITKLLVACEGIEAKFIIRSLEGKLRIGLAEKTVIVALAHASVLSKEGGKIAGMEAKLAAAANTVKEVYNSLPVYDRIIPVLLNEGVDSLHDLCKLTPGIPLKPMLAHPTKSLSKVLDRFESVKFTCEFKYDGERAQIHMLENGQFMIFSRNSEDMSTKYPDIMQAMPKVTKENVKSYVLDCEAVAWDRTKNCILPFQVLSTRKRKDVDMANITVKVCVFAFDILYLNGEVWSEPSELFLHFGYSAQLWSRGLIGSPCGTPEQSLIHEPLRRRTELLHQSFVELEGYFGFAKSRIGDNVSDIQAFLDESVKNNCEGLMVKVVDGPDSFYKPSKRCLNWLKVKKDYLDGVGDTLDLVVIGAYAGRGKRAGVYGGFLLACYDPDTEEYQSICKIGSGFSEEQLNEHHKQLEPIEEPKSYYRYSDTTKPYVWFKPSQVWEVQCADLSISPVYHAAIGKVDETKGISLRFPRFIRVREDKTPEQATTSDQVAEFYRKQAVVANNVNSKAEGDADDEFDY